MSYYKKIICRPINDNNKRFLLGKNGTVEMMAIGLNPSKANEGKLDPTSRNIEKIANNNGCNGWWLVNLYPLRTSREILSPLTILLSPFAPHLARLKCSCKYFVRI